MKPKVLIPVYGLISITAFVLCLMEFIPYTAPGAGGVPQFVRDLFVNPATRFITIDIVSYFFAGCIWMVFEARRLAMKHVWAYIAVGFFVAIGVAFPLFLIHREVVMGRSDGAGSVGLT